MPEVTGEMSALERALYALECELRSNPRPSTLDRAREIYAAQERESLPDWVEILANGNAEAWEAVVETALADLRADGGAA